MLDYGCMKPDKKQLNTRQPVNDVKTVSRISKSTLLGVDAVVRTALACIAGRRDRLTLQRKKLIAEAMHKYAGPQSFSA